MAMPAWLGWLRWVDTGKRAGSTNWAGKIGNGRHGLGSATRAESNDDVVGGRCVFGLGSGLVKQGGYGLIERW
ncbi:hypothetical protein M0R45_002302 [Rubus argutus]|uniref:Uncharacterized protein n=1 Tax=Rubus argutus TaxID=59490 RepID=A0AAW1VJR7_RUBAR